MSMASSWLSPIWRSHLVGPKLGEYVLVERASPVPTPRRNRSGSMQAAVAGAWATMAEWTRNVGQVTAVVTGSAVVGARPPMTHQTKGDWRWASIHGWLWSEIHQPSNPARSARWACPRARRGCVLRWPGVSDACHGHAPRCLDGEWYCVSSLGEGWCSADCHAQTWTGGRPASAAACAGHRRLVPRSGTYGRPEVVAASRPVKLARGAPGLPLRVGHGRLGTPPRTAR